MIATGEALPTLSLPRQGATLLAVGGTQPLRLHLRGAATMVLVELLTYGGEAEASEPRTRHPESGVRRER